jgi:release factor glutamine methyltransferase
MTNNLAVGEWLRFARLFLQNCPPDEECLNSYTLEVQVLLACVLEKPRAWVLAHPEALLGSQQQDLLDSLVKRLRSGEPLAYLTGCQEFFGINFEVSPDVLIPRPETELLVERALAWLKEQPDRRRAVDVGTGSGCIAVSIAAHAPHLRWLAVDRSWKALQVARRNAFQHGVEDRVAFILGDLLTACAGPFDLVCANLPYIPREVLRQLPVARYEPLLALDGGADGLGLIHRLLGDAHRFLAPDGRILLEMQFDQGEYITHIASQYLPGANATVLPDLAGLPRLVEIKLS